MQLAWWEVASPRRTGRACCDKMFLLVHAWSHTGGRLLLAWNLPASGGISLPVAFRLFILPLLTLLVWRFWRFPRLPHHRLWQSSPTKNISCLPPVPLIPSAWRSRPRAASVLSSWHKTNTDLGTRAPRWGAIPGAPEQTSPLAAGSESLQLPGTGLTCFWCCFNHAAGTLNKTVSKRKDLDCFDNLQPEELTVK